MRPHLAAAGAALAVLTLGACTADPAPHAPASTNEVEAMFTKNIDRWAMPFDSFAMPPESHKQSTARWALVRGCMVDKGHTGYPAPPYPTDVESGTRNSWYRYLFNETTAAQWGYHDEDTGSSGPIRAAEAAANAIIDRAEADFDECSAAASDTVGPNPEGVLDVSSLGVGAYSGADQDPAVREAVARWRECMAPLGIVDLPDDPLEMPSDSLLARFGWVTEGGDGTVTAQAGADEITVATADAACRESSGYRQARYDAEWDRQIEQVATNLAALERTKEAWDAYETHLDELIAAHGG